MPIETEKTHIGVEASKSQDSVAQISCLRLSIYDQQGLPPEWLIKGNEGCGIVAAFMLTYKPHCGEDKIR